MKAFRLFDLYRRMHSGRLPAALALLAPMALWNGCFTEVGNPIEEEMVAVLRLATSLEDSAGPAEILAPDSVRVSHLVLKLAGADEYSSGRITRTLWDVGGHPAAFTPGDTLPTAPMAPPAGADSVVVRLGVYAQAGIASADTLRWDAFESHRYVKGAYSLGGKTRRFLFDLTDTARFSPSYARAALESWHVGKTYHCHFVFRPRAWLAQAGLDTARAFAAAGGDSVVIFDASRNAALHAALLRRFGKAFNDSKAYGAMPRSTPYVH